MHLDSVEYVNDVVGAQLGAVGSFWAQLVSSAETKAILEAMVSGLMSQRGKR